MTLGYEQYGKGTEPVVVLHEWMATHRSYESIRPYLDPKTYTYFFADHRGYGLSKGLSGQHTIQEAATDVLQLADVLGLSRFHLVGHSMSGLIAQWLTLEAADRLRSVVLVTPAPATGVSLDSEGQALFEAAVTDDQQFKTIIAMVTGHQLGQAYYESRLQQFRPAVDPHAFARFLKMWTTADFSSKMQQLSTPTFVISGAYDLPIFQEGAYRQTLGQWYQNIHFKTMPGVGHFPMTEAPPHFAAVVESFLQDH